MADAWIRVSKPRDVGYVSWGAALYAWGDQRVAWNGLADIDVWVRIEKPTS